MTPNEFQTAQVQLTQVDTELAGLNQAIQDSLTQARACNQRTAELRNKHTTLGDLAKPIREAVALYVQEVKRAQAAQAKVEAEAQAKAEVEAKAKEVSETDRLKAENDELKAKLKLANKE